MTSIADISPCEDGIARPAPRARRGRDIEFRHADSEVRPSAAADRLAAEPDGPATRRRQPPDRTPTV